jgi:DnaJ like chaperone protein
MPPIVYGIFFVIAVIIKIIWKSSSKVIEVGKDAFGDVFSETQCHKCGKANNKKDKFCIYCGSELHHTASASSQKKAHSDVKQCTKCGAENELANKFCIQCGSSEFLSIDISKLENSIGGYVATLSAYIAKSDNIITKAEAQLISEMFTQLSNNDVEIRKGFKIVFEKAKDISIKNHTYIANKLHSAISTEIDYLSRQPLYTALGFYFMELVYIDGDFNQTQNTVVTEILRCLKISESEINNIRRSFHKEEQKSSGGSSSSSSSNPSLEEAYKTLGCSSSDSNEVIKKAYKELAKQYHPDTVSGKGLAGEFIKFANQRFQEINNAYDKIKQTRGMR